MWEIDIRPMKLNDIAQVFEIEKNTFSLPWSVNSFKDACQKQENIYLVADIKGEIAGYCGLWTVTGEGNITNMAVAQKYRKNGIAFRLMREMERIALEKSTTIFFLEVRASNIAAIKLYQKMGYSNIGIRKNFYEKPLENAIIMSKKIEQ